MKLLYILALILLLAGTFVGELMVKDPGYVLLSYQNTTIETSVWGLAIVALVSFILLHAALRFLQYVLERRRKIKDWSENRTRVRANRRTLRGLLALSSGDWTKAQRLLTDAADKTETPLINYLAAARAAHEQGLPDASDRFLQQAQKAMPKADLAIGITRAQIQISRGQLESGLETLKELRGQAPRHSYIMKMLKDIYLQQQDWESLSGLIPYLQKNDVLKADQLKSLERRASLGRMERALAALPVGSDTQVRLKTLNKTWKGLSADLNCDAGLVANYATQLAENGAADKAESTLREAIRRDWNDDLVKLYGQIAGSNPAKQLNTAEEWLGQHPDDASLLLTLGRLSLLNSQWQQAREYFERSLSVNSCQETYNELARLLHHLDDAEGCKKLMAESLESVAETLPKLPLPPAANA